MKKQILEVQNYFVNKIIECQFDSYKFGDLGREWINIKVIIDGYLFDFSINPKYKLITHHRSFMDLKVPKTRLNNIFDFVEKEKARIKAERIEKLKSELAELTTNNFEV